MAQSQASRSSDFIFVNVSSAKGEKQRKHMRKVVRSAATAYSHRMQPRGASKSEMTLKSLRPGRSTHATDPPTTEAIEDSENSQHRRDARQKVTASVASISRKRDMPTFDQQSVDTHLKRMDRSPSPGPVNLWFSDPPLMDTSIKGPFDSYPVEYRKWYGQLINFWYHVTFARSTRVLKATWEEINAYSIWSRRQELQEPALFHTALYLASGIPVAEGLFPVQAALWLRRQWKP